MRKKKEYIIVKRYVSNKWFAVLLLVMGIIGIAFILHQIFSYTTLVQPQLENLYPFYTTNNVSGLNYLAYFTIISNLVISLYFVSLALSIFGVKGFKNLVLNPSLVSAVVLYLFIVGFVYCGVLSWFIQDYEWNTPLFFHNIISYWQHIIVPLFMLVLLFRPFTNQTIPKKCAFYYLIFPFIYLVFSLLRGGLGTSHFYAYPFFNAQMLWTYLGLGSQYQSTLAIIYMIVSLLILLVLFYLFARFIIYTHNSNVKKIFYNTIEQKTAPDEKTDIIYKS